jgi:SAM-dependent methyltransferase
VDGIPIVLRDLAEWATSEGPSALQRRDLDAEVVSLLAVDTASRRNRRLLEVYGAPLESPYSTWLAGEQARSEGVVLEVGAGASVSGAVRLDLNLSLLAAGGFGPGVVEHEGVAGVVGGSAVVADAADPPFLAGAFSSVLVLNLLDSCADPALVLAQADALVAPGGTLVVACAFAFDASITAPERQFSEGDLEAALRGERAFGAWGLGCRLDGEPLDLLWRLRVGPRSEHVHHVRVLRARRAG